LFLGDERTLLPGFIRRRGHQLQFELAARALASWASSKSRRQMP
jgi:hypothetical protein